ncbi:MAG: adenylate kinase [Acidobacteriota bacterium]
MCLILFGAPGSGKGTQAKLLKNTLELPHISTGDMLRERVARRDELGLQVESLLQAGALVPDATVNALVAERIEQPDCEPGFILDGYPRTVSQAGILTEMLRSRSIAAVVVHLKVDYNVIVARLAGRRQCPVCGALYSLSPNAPTVSEVCDYDGSTLVVRDDDREEVVTERMKAYDRQTSPVLEYFRSSGFHVWEVDGAQAGGPQAIARLIQGMLKDKGYRN